MRNLTSPMWLGLLLLCSMNAVALAKDVPVFRWQKAVTIESAPAKGLLSIPFDSEIYSGTQNQFPDLRLVDATRQSVPFLIRKRSEQQERVTRSSWVARNPELHPSEAVGLEIRIGLDKDDPQPTSLKFVTGLKNFEQRVQIFGTEPGQLERSLVKESLIFDYSQFMDVRRLEVPLPASKCRSFRVIVGALTSNQESEVLQLTRRLRGPDKVETDREERTSIQRRPFHIERLEFWGETKKFGVKSEIETTYALKKTEVTEDKQKHETIITLVSRQEPLTDIVLATENSNFRRAARVEVLHKPGVRADWREIGATTISKFAIADINESHLKVSFPEQRHETYRIVISNGDSAPVEFSEISAIGRSYEALCLADKAGSLSLVYGSDLIERPNYDVAALQLAIDRGLDAESATVGPQTEATSAEAMPINLKKLLNNPIVLGVVVCVLVGLLGVSLVKAGKKISALPPDE